MNIEEAREVARTSSINVAANPPAKVKEAFRVLFEATSPSSEAELDAEACAYYTYPTECTRRERKAYVKGALRVGRKQ